MFPTRRKGKSQSIDYTAAIAIPRKSSTLNTLHEWLRDHTLGEVLNSKRTTSPIHSYDVTLYHRPLSFDYLDTITHTLDLFIHHKVNNLLLRDSLPQRWLSFHSFLQSCLRMQGPKAFILDMNKAGPSLNRHDHKIIDSDGKTYFFSSNLKHSIVKNDENGDFSTPNNSDSSIKSADVELKNVKNEHEEVNNKNNFKGQVTIQSLIENYGMSLSPGLEVVDQSMSIADALDLWYIFSSDNNRNLENSIENLYLPPILCKCTSSSPRSMSCSDIPSLMLSEQTVEDDTRVTDTKEVNLKDNGGIPMVKLQSTIDQCKLNDNSGTKQFKSAEVPKRRVQLSRTIHSIEVITPADVWRYMGLYADEIKIQLASDHNPSGIPCLPIECIPFASIYDSAETVIHRLLDSDHPGIVVGLTDGYFLTGTLTIHNAAAIILSMNADNKKIESSVSRSPSIRDTGLKQSESIQECVRRNGLGSSVLRVTSYQEGTCSVIDILKKMTRHRSHHIWRLDDSGKPSGLVLLPHIIRYVRGNLTC